MLFETLNSSEHNRSLRIELRYKLICFANIFSGVLGSKESLTGLERAFEMVQSEALNQHLLFTLSDYTLKSISEALSIK